MPWPISKLQSAVIGLLLSFAFLYYYAYAVVGDGGVSALVVRAIAPILKTIHAAVGVRYSHALGRIIGLSTAGLATYVFLLPYRYLVQSRAAALVLGTFAVVPTAFLSFAGGFPTSAFQLYATIQPLLGLALFAAFHARPIGKFPRRDAA
jgi:hypothetical protein